MDETGKSFIKQLPEEKYEGEAEKYNCERYVIEKGVYIAVTITDWRKKTDCIKDVFHDMMEDDRADAKPKRSLNGIKPRQRCFVS